MDAEFADRGWSRSRLGADYLFRTITLQARARARVFLCVQRGSKYRASAFLSGIVMISAAYKNLFAVARL